MFNVGDIVLRTGRDNHEDCPVGTIAVVSGVLESEAGLTLFVDHPGKKVSTIDPAGFGELWIATYAEIVKCGVPQFAPGDLVERAVRANHEDCPVGTIATVNASDPNEDYLYVKYRGAREICPDGSVGELWYKENCKKVNPTKPKGEMKILENPSGEKGFLVIRDGEIEFWSYDPKYRSMVCWRETCT